MIIAVLKRMENDGQPYLAGKLTSNWPLPVGTKIVLRKVGDEYQLLELAPRPVKFDPQGVLSFVNDEAED